jgi:biopolymer transport protein ExbD
MSRSLFAFLFLPLLLSLLMTSCDEERKPVPILTIKVLANGQYELNGEQVSRQKLRSEIQRIADENRRNITDTSRVYVRLGNEAGASQAIKNDVVNMCLSAGINNIQHSAADE